MSYQTNEEKSPPIDEMKRLIREKIVSDHFEAIQSSIETLEAGSAEICGHYVEFVGKHKGDKVVCSVTICPILPDGTILGILDNWIVKMEDIENMICFKEREA